MPGAVRQGPDRDFQEGVVAGRGMQHSVRALVGLSKFTLSPLSPREAICSGESHGQWNIASLSSRRGWHSMKWTEVVMGPLKSSPPQFTR